VCYSFDDQAEIAILKYHMGYMVIFMVIFVQIYFWSRVYLARKYGYEVKYSFWVNLLHPFKFNKPKFTTKQKWLFRISNVALFLLPNIYMLSIVLNTFCF
jgi:hypothetical protein